LWPTQLTGARSGQADEFRVFLTAPSIVEAEVPADSIAMVEPAFHHDLGRFGDGVEDRRLVGLCRRGLRAGGGDVLADE